MSSSLPSELPIFPLRGALLLPHGHLPLHIFEPRYRAMVDHALACGRVIGMVQPKGSYPEPQPDDAELFATGCSGRIVSFAESDDGRFFITLKGLCRFRVMTELPLLRGFRRIIPDFTPFTADVQEPDEGAINREGLLQAARCYLTAKGIDCDWQAADAAPIAALVTTFAMTCPFEPREKQALLECATLVDRSNLLVSLLQMGAYGSDTPPSGARH